MKAPEFFQFVAVEGGGYSQRFHTETFFSPLTIAAEGGGRKWKI